MKKIIVTNFFLLVALLVYPQKDINNYKYVVIPLKYDFLKGKDKYRLNGLTRFLFKKRGYQTYFEEEELPKDLSEDRCLAMYANVIKLTGFLSTKLQIELRDCQGELIIVSQVGKTKEKERSKAYNIALREAFETFEFIDYNYMASESKEIASQQQKLESEESKELGEMRVKQLSKEAKVIEEERDSIKSKKNVESNVKLEKAVSVKPNEEPSSEESTNAELLFAQPIDKGFQIINMEPKIVMILLNTENKDMFKVEGREAIVFKKEDQWIYAETIDSKTTERVLNIRF